MASGIARVLAADHEVHTVGLGRSVAREPWTGHLHHQANDSSRTSAVSRLTSAIAPDLVLILGQATLTAWMVVRLRRDGFSGAVVVYMPVEGRLRDARPLAGLGQATAIVTYTPATRDALSGMLASPRADRAPPHVGCIPHALDPPDVNDSTRPELRAELLPRRPDRHEGRWLLNANRNDARKRPELTVRAFAAIADQVPTATLVLHCEVARRGVDLRIDRDRFGLRESLILTKEADQRPWSSGRLRRLYGSCEIGVNTASGEGWGLVAFEHALCGGAQILPAHATLREIWGDAPSWIATGDDAPIDEAFSGRTPDVDALSGALLELLTQPARTRQVAAACRRRAADPRYGWDEVGTRWRMLVSRLLDNRDGR
jgi:D-inositol-3-phosphate glycosyltransferase